MDIARCRLLFVYGTLCDDDVLRIVLGHDLPVHCRYLAALQDHECRMLHDERYPVLVSSPGSRVAGRVLMLGEADMQRICFFEGDEYTFEPARVVNEVTNQLQEVELCAARLTTPGLRHPWSLRGWQREYKAEFVEHVHAYMALYDTASVAQADAVWKKLTGRSAGSANQGIPVPDTASR